MSGTEIEPADGSRSPRRRPYITIAWALWLAAGGALALPGEGRAHDIAVAITLYSKAVPLDPGDLSRRRVGGLEYMGGLELTSDEEAFGGYSGLVVAGDGTRMTAVSDRGHWLTARLVHDAGGMLTGVTNGAMSAIRDATGRPVRSPWHDSEDLVGLAGGGYAVSFERRHRIMLYPADAPGSNAPGRMLTFPMEASTLASNGGIEGLAELADGSLLAVAEQPVGDAGTSLAWLFPPGFGAPAPLSYRLRHGFLPTALARLPGGDVLALERRFTLASGIAIRLLRIEAGSIVPGATLDGDEIARIGVGFTVDNFEGLAVRQGGDGAVYIYVVSDDNHNSFQRTLLMQFRLVE